MSFPDALFYSVMWVSAFSCGALAVFQALAFYGAVLLQNIPVLLSSAVTFFAFAVLCMTIILKLVGA
jgi:hypothetical protein